MEIAPSEGRMMRIPGNEGELVSKQRMTIAPLLSRALQWMGGPACRR
jgi:hypothetical protein